MITSFEDLTDQGYHAVIVTDSVRTAMHPLTDQGLEAIRSMLIDIGAPDDVLTQRERGAMVRGAVPEQLAKALEVYGLPDGSVGILDSGVQITPVEIHKSVH